MKSAHTTLIFAHRGANHEAAENTRGAFDKALKYAIDGIETDVQLSRDDVTVLWHDRFLDKLDLPDQRIDDFDYAQLCAMNFAGHFFAPGDGHEGIMSLQALLDTYRHRCRLLIEVKNRDGETQTRHEIKIRQTLDRIGAINNDVVLVSSFHLASLVYAHRYRADCPLIYNFEPEQTLTDAQQILTAHPFLHGLCLPIATLNSAIIALLHSLGKCVAVYTCNSYTEITKALNLGVDILISDVPDQALRIRDS